MVAPSGGSTSNVYTFPLKLLGLRGGCELESKESNEGGRKVITLGALFAKDGKRHFLTTLNTTAITGSRNVAVISLVLAPIWISIRAIFSVIGSITNIVTLGSLSVEDDLIKNSLKGRVKAMGCSFLSLVTTPFNMAVEALATISHIFKPELNKIDLLAAHMWTGFVVASLSEKIVSSELSKHPEKPAEKE